MMKAYDTYVEIGLPWLSSVPAHWNISRNKHVFSEKKELVGNKDKNYRLLSLTLNGIIPRDVSSGKGKFPASFDKYKVVKPGYMAFCLFDIDETPRTVGLSAHDGMLTGAYTIMEVRGVNPRYAYYYYLALDNVKALKPLYTGLRKTIKVEIFQSIKMPIPQSDEQSQIVRYLDWKTSEINKLITAKKKQIELLTEHRQALIDSMVFSSLDTSDQIENGNIWGIPIPKTWNVLKFNQVFKFGKGLAITKADLIEEGVPVISYGQVHSKLNCGTRINDSLIRFVSKNYLDSSPSCIVNKGDFIFADTSEDFAGVGNCVYVDQVMDLFAGYHTVIARPKDGKENRYYAYLFKSSAWRYQLRKQVNGVKVFSITQKILKNAYVITPPSNEQERIVAALDTSCATIDNMVIAIRKEIDCFHELRTRLISDVVTGQIDVRNAEIPEFEYVEEIEDESDEDIENTVEDTEDEEV